MENPKMSREGAVLGAKMGEKWVKRRFSKNDPRPLGVHEQVFSAHFEPVWIDFSPFRHMYAPSCTLHTHLRAVWWSHL